MRVNTLKYVDAKYLPRPNFILKRPRAMNFDLLREFFAHVAEREKTFEPAEVFCFYYTDPRRTEIQGDEDDEDEDESESENPGAKNTGGTDSGEGRGDAQATAGPSVAAGDASCADVSNCHQENNNPSGNGGACSPAPAINHNVARAKKTKTQKSHPGPPARKTKRKQTKKTHNEPTAHPAAGAAGTGEISRPGPKAYSVTCQVHEVQVTSDHAPGPNDDPLAPDGAEAPPLPCPRPRPVTRPVNQSTGNPTDGTSNHTPASEHNQQGPTQSRGGVPDAAIDPLLLAVSNQRSRALVNTSDNLALQEARRFAVTTKCVSKKKRAD